MNLATSLPGPKPGFEKVRQEFRGYSLFWQKEKLNSFSNNLMNTRPRYWDIAVSKRKEGPCSHFTIFYLGDKASMLCQEVIYL